MSRVSLRRRLRKFVRSRGSSLSKTSLETTTQVLSAWNWLGPISDSRHWPRVLFSRPSLPESSLSVPLGSFPRCNARVPKYLRFQASVPHRAHPAFGSSVRLSLAPGYIVSLFLRQVTVSRIKYFPKRVCQRLPRACNALDPHTRARSLKYDATRLRSKSTESTYSTHAEKLDNFYRDYRVKSAAILTRTGVTVIVHDRAARAREVPGACYAAVLSPAHWTLFVSRTSLTLSCPLGYGTRSCEGTKNNGRIMFISV